MVRRFERNAQGGWGEKGHWISPISPATALFPRSRASYFRLACFIFATSLLSENLAQASSRKRDEDLSLVCYASPRSTLHPVGNPSMLLVHVLCLLVTWQILDQLPGCFLGKALAFLIRGTAFQWRPIFFSKYMIFTVSTSCKKKAQNHFKWLARNSPTCKNMTIYSVTGVNVQGGSAPRSNSLLFYTPFLTFSYTLYWKMVPPFKYLV